MTMGWSIRVAEPCDADQISGIEQRSFSERSWGVAGVKQTLAAPSVDALIASSDDNCSPPVGFVIWRAIPPDAELLSIGVEPSMQGAGVGAALLHALVKRIVEQSVTTIYLEVAEKNQAALQLYNKFGFVCFGRRDAYYKSGANALVLKLNI